MNSKIILLNLGCSLSRKLFNFLPILIFFITTNVFSQSFAFDISGQSISILNSNSTLIVGTAPGLAVGSVHQYANVLTISGRQIYARLSIVSATNASVTDFDDETLGIGEPERFQPQIATTAANGVAGFVRFRLDFFDTATNFPVYLSNFFITGVDIDGLSVNERELLQLREFTSYRVNNPNGFTISNVAPYTQFLGVDSSVNGIVFGNNSAVIAFYNNPKTSVDFTIGATGVTSNRRASVAFGVPAGTFTNPVTTTNNAILTTTNLAVLKSVSNPTPIIGSNVSFTITATNGGPSAATGVQVLDQLPSGYTFVSSSGTDYNNTTGIWTIGNLANGASTSLTIVATVRATGNYLNAAGITGNEIDPVTANNSANASVSPLPDNDNDGIANSADLDDDNDGILDLNESCDGFLAQNTSGVWKGVTSSNLTVALSNGTAQVQASTTNDGQINYNEGVNGGDNRVASSQNITYTYTFSTPVPANELAFRVIDVDPITFTGQNVATTGYTLTINGVAVNNDFIKVIPTATTDLLYNAATGKITLNGTTTDNQRI